MAKIEKGEFYVYVCEDDGIVAYVGKGCGRRHKQSAKRLGLPSRIIEHFEREDDAFARERELIAELKPTENICAGGNGGRSRPKPLTAEERKVEREWRRVERDYHNIGPRRYCARFLTSRLSESNIEQFGVSKIDLDRLREVANGPWC